MVDATSAEEGILNDGRREIAILFFLKKTVTVFYTVLW
jgi:hypothetical protein